MNVCFTQAADEFGKWVTERIEARNAKFILNKNLEIKMDPQILAAFQASTHASSKYRRTGRK